MEIKSSHENKDLSFLNQLEYIVYNLNTENLDESVKKVMDIFDNDFPYLFIHIISQLVFSSIVSQKGNFDFAIQFLKILQEKNKEHIKINYTKNKLFSMLNFSYRPQESYYIIEKMIEQGLVDPSFVKSQPTYYFAHYFSKDEIISKCFNSFKNYFTKNIEKLSNNDWELHKKYVKEGVNPNEIAKIIRNDEIEKLQEMTAQNDFNFNQEIEPSLYERYSFINEENVSLIDYAAFFGSINCFRFLLLNGANVNKTGKYAIAGANLEIIHLCEQNHTDFRDTHEIAIEYHRNDIFKYMYDKKIYQFKDLAAIGRKCILFFNYELLSFLEEEGMKTNDVLVNESAKIGNIYLIKHFLEGYDRIPTNILYCSIISENIELVKYIIEEKKFDVNTKNTYGEEPIITASLNNLNEILKFFLENYKFNINKTPLIFASMNNNTEIVKLLLEQKGIDLNAKDNDGYTALLYASKNGYIEIVKLLLEQKEIDVNVKDKHGEVSLIVASLNDHIEIVKLLLEQKGIDINAKNKNGWTAFMYASFKGKINIVKLLLEQKGIDINARNKDGRTALMLASLEGHSEIVKLLLEQKGIDINTQSQGGKTLSALEQFYQNQIDRGIKEILSKMKK